MSNAKSGKCCICLDYVTVLHWHHTIPRSVGGENSELIPLCATCHNSLHAHANAILAKINSGTSIKRTYWKDDTSSYNAEKFVGIVVKHTLNYDGSGKEYKMNIAVSNDIRIALQKLKQELPGITSVPDTISYCIVQVLSNRGLYKNEKEHNRKERGIKRKTISKTTKADLW